MPLLALLAAADETVTSQAWWTQVVSILVTAGSIAGAVWAFLRFVPGVRTWWAHRQERRKLVRAKAMADVVIEALKPVERRIDKNEGLISARHRSTTTRLDDIDRQLNRIDHGQKEIHRRIDRHMDEEREERQQDRSELLGWLNVVGAMRRDDMQSLRDRRSMAVEQAKQEP